MDSTSTQPAATSKRLQGLDTLRAHMMLLGIVFHAALSYTATPANDVWPLRDPVTSNSLSVLVSVLASFRMPVFFIVAGFFFCLLQERKGLNQALHDRARRIAFPLMGFLPVMVVMCGYGFTWGMQQSPHAQAIEIEFNWLQLYHLWFLYFLLLFYTVSGVLTQILRYFKLSLYVQSERTFLLGIATWALMLSLFMWLGSPLELGASITFIPHLDPLLFYSIFFFCGYWLYYQRAWLSVLEKRFWWLLSLSLLMLAVGLTSIGVMGSPLNQLSWLEWVPLTLAQLGIYFCVIAGYLRWAKKGSPLGSYLSAASYWVYLVHLPLVIWSCNLIAPLDTNAYIKLLINIALTVSASLASYHFFVRDTWLGQWLNGKKSVPTSHSYSVHAT